VLIVAAAGGVYYEFFALRDPIPQNIRSQVNFSLYYPKSLPSGWSIDKSSYYADANDKVVGYRILAPVGPVSLSIQPIPQNFSFNSFYTKRLSDTIQFLTPLGQGAVGKTSGQLVGSLETPSAWVLVSTGSNGVAQTDIQFILNHLQSTSN
jgi:hypothetical protein